MTSSFLSTQKLDHSTGAQWYGKQTDPKNKIFQNNLVDTPPQEMCRAITKRQREDECSLVYDYRPVRATCNKKNLFDTSIHC